eukprot:CAMPEP_0174965382 /NCGR_PEP_ID=MMETSP0004_2-20121128/6405_1 /TAXON_ID=420556 /ORGANISM="Ochromonas sp., Strain CCMP1393" /LENGTH=220 /DNA_ID=CAMNT_0016214213 /DNA_START=57 /DNA_END=720 /DNA_ORIENTATION=-
MDTQVSEVRKTKKIKVTSMSSEILMLISDFLKLYFTNASGSTRNTGGTTGRWCCSYCCNSRSIETSTGITREMRMQRVDRTSDTTNFTTTTTSTATTVLLPREKCIRRDGCFCHYNRRGPSGLEEVTVTVAVAVFPPPMEAVLPVPRDRGVDNTPATPATPVAPVAPVDGDTLTEFPLEKRPGDSKLFINLFPNEFDPPTTPTSSIPLLLPTLLPVLRSL